MSVKVSIDPHITGLAALMVNEFRVMTMNHISSLRQKSASLRPRDGVTYILLDDEPYKTVKEYLEGRIDARGLVPIVQSEFDKANRAFTDKINALPVHLQFQFEDVLGYLRKFQNASDEELVAAIEMSKPYLDRVMRRYELAKVQLFNYPEINS